MHVFEAFKAGKHVFVEKPLCLNETELNEIRDIYQTKVADSNVSPLLMVGYNRRFSPLTNLLKEHFFNTTMAMQYRINAGAIPKESWYQDSDIGGGRIIGEVCHFIDLLIYLNGSLPVSVFACEMKDPQNIGDTLSITLSFENGSLGTISYFSNGDKLLQKERIEIFAGGNTAIIDDFKSLTMYIGGKKKKKNLSVQDKGQKDEVHRFIEAIKRGGEEIIPFREIYASSLVTFKILESIKAKRPIDICI